MGFRRGGARVPVVAAMGVCCGTLQRQVHAEASAATELAATQHSEVVALLKQLDERHAAAATERDALGARGDVAREDVMEAVALLKEDVTAMRSATLAHVSRVVDEAKEELLEAGRRDRARLEQQLAAVLSQLLRVNEQQVERVLHEARAVATAASARADTLEALLYSQTELVSDGASDAVRVGCEAMREVTREALQSCERSAVRGRAQLGDALERLGDRILKQQDAAMATRNEVLWEELDRRYKEEFKRVRAAMQKDDETINATMHMRSFASFKKLLHEMRVAVALDAGAVLRQHQVQVGDNALRLKRDAVPFEPPPLIEGQSAMAALASATAKGKSKARSDMTPKGTAARSAPDTGGQPPMSAAAAKGALLAATMPPGGEARAALDPAHAASYNAIDLETKRAQYLYRRLRQRKEAARAVQAATAAAQSNATDSPVPVASPADTAKASAREAKGGPKPGLSIAIASPTSRSPTARAPAFRTPKLNSSSPLPSTPPGASFADIARLSPAAQALRVRQSEVADARRQTTPPVAGGRGMRQAASGGDSDASLTSTDRDVPETDSPPHPGRGSVQGALPTGGGAQKAGSGGAGDGESSDYDASDDSTSDSSATDADEDAGSSSTGSGSTAAATRASARKPAASLRGGTAGTSEVQDPLHDAAHSAGESSTNSSEDEGRPGANG